MPASYVFHAPRSNSKVYLHNGDAAKVMCRKTIGIRHSDGTCTKATCTGAGS